MLLINNNNSIQINITIYKYSMREILSVDIFTTIMVKPEIGINA